MLGISEDITLDAISAKFYITFIGEDDDESFDKYDETLILHFFGKEIPISYNATRGYYAVYETLNGITIGVINDNYYDKKITWSVTYSIEKKSILTPSDFYITKKSSVPFANAIMPQANQNAFQACLAFNTEKLPNGLTELSSMVFSSCKSLTLANIPADVKTIGSQAFYNCIGLTTLTFQGTPTTIAANAFEGCTNLTTINVPWAEGTVANAPWGATNATINYNYTGA